ncbi:hypothetical protein K2173_003840 [Erythroxylum novogranatense]|uniref:Uncharacterized protein n=1 Tax=Erythroxylum novogranatense TaxID=1862640 RepID=A0AAV8S421_9ROSI|nr:hypothetical protein K2173_003840 [Erythroxylum novogranatense]
MEVHLLPWKMKQFKELKRMQDHPTDRAKNFMIVSCRNPLCYGVNDNKLREIIGAALCYYWSTHLISL